MDGHASPALVAQASAADGFVPLLRKSLSAHGLLLAVALTNLTIFILLDLTHPGMGSKNSAEVLVGIATFSLPALLFGLLIYLFFDMALNEAPAHPIAALLSSFKNVLTDRRRMAAGLPVSLALVIFMYVFTMVKAYIPVINPYSWDVTLDRWDQALHFGYRPWELLQPVLGYWPVTFLINLNYNMWFVMMNVFWVYHAFILKPSAERTRFFLAYMLIWMVGGGFLAIVFSSAGPCYFTRLGITPDPYAPLMAYLHQAASHVPIWALMTQDMLWNLQQQNSAFGGISAMPSMHSATALLFFLASAGMPRALRITIFAHAALIFIGSVHLGWHFAIDGYAGWAIAFLLWQLSGPIARRWEHSEAACEYRAALQERAAHVLR